MTRVSHDHLSDPVRLSPGPSKLRQEPSRSFCSEGAARWRTCPPEGGEQAIRPSSPTGSPRLSAEGCLVQLLGDHIIGKAQGPAVDTLVERPRRISLHIIDEVGYTPFGVEAAKLLIQLISAATGAPASS
jgi:hypothetical protein